MATGFQPNITIKEAIDHIDRQEYLLPSIQRKFVWSAPQIETLFDSIMRGYPINSFMFWHIYDAEIKKNFKFYKFLSAYREFSKSIILILTQSDALTLTQLLMDNNA